MRNHKSGYHEWDGQVLGVPRRQTAAHLGRPETTSVEESLFALPKIDQNMLTEWLRTDFPLN
ncbi:MAG TPA: hypothetical protein VGJ04_10065 [Pirellulales bacterium]